MTDLFTILRRTTRHLRRPPAGGSGRGGTFGVPSRVPDEAPPSADQEGNWVVSGGGLAGPRDDAIPASAARRSPSESDPSHP